MRHAGAEADLEPPLGQDVGQRQVLGETEGALVADRDDGGAQFDPLGALAGRARNTAAEPTPCSRWRWRIQAPSKPNRSPYSNSWRVSSRPVYGSSSAKLPGVRKASEVIVGVLM
ncbi:hypothetical protein ACGFWE_01200 [Streptomyces sp. NPDC048523]|uniref:hypothetical protein n=1 Tax=Streptomyces sp. NPDC048523 TaxID=3365567 RepID=UPI003720DE70